MRGFAYSAALLLFFAVASAKVSYEGHQVWRLHLPTENLAPLLNAVLEKFNFDVWDISRTHVDIRVKPTVVPLLDIALKNFDLEYDVMIENLQTLIDQEGKNVNRELRFDFANYHTLSEIEAYLTEVAANSSLATLDTIGQTYEGRDQYQLTISTGPGKPSIWVDCGIHAREWITPATCLYGIDLLTNGYGINPDVKTLLDTYDVFVLPVYNPDGYDYTWTDDRMWRKNRIPNDGSPCLGVDLNRNFEDHWGFIGSSNVSCADTYHGTGPASEMETQNSQGKIVDMIANNDLRMIYTIHSYSQYWMYAFGYTAALPAEVNELNATAQVGVSALTAVHDTPYLYGPLYTVLYPAAGTTVDYGYAQGIIHSYLLELRDTGEFGFLLPAEQIIPTAEETWAGLIAAMLYI